jgi:hypothetical protein
VIAALLLAAAPHVDAYDAVFDAQFAAQDCEGHYLTHQWVPRSESAEELQAEARRACTSLWEEHGKARLTYYANHRRSIRRLVPGFSPELEICWSAFETEIYRWTGMPENMARPACKDEARKRRGMTGKGSVG